MGRVSPAVVVLGSWLAGWMAFLGPLLQFIIAVLTVVYLVYQIRLARKRIAEKKSDGLI